jgi:hypothetical protein
MSYASIARPIKGGNVPLKTKRKHKWGSEETLNGRKVKRCKRSGCRVIWDLGYAEANLPSCEGN